MFTYVPAPLRGGAPVALALLVALPSPARPQDGGLRFELSPRVAWVGQGSALYRENVGVQAPDGTSHELSELHLESGLGVGIEAALRWPDRPVSVFLGFLHQPTQIRGEGAIELLLPSASTSFAVLSAGLQMEPRRRFRVQPYGRLGVGLVSLARAEGERRTNPALDLGAGGRARLGRNHNVSIFLEARAARSSFTLDAAFLGEGVKRRGRLPLARSQLAGSLNLGVALGLPGPR